MNIEEICRKGIYLPKKDENGEWIIIHLTDIAFTFAYDVAYFYSQSYEERSFVLDEADITWFTSYEAAENFIEGNEE